MTLHIDFPSLLASADRRTLMDEEGRDFRQLEITTLAGANVTSEEATAYQAAGIHTLYMLTTSDKPQELFAQMKQFAGRLREYADQ